MSLVESLETTFDSMLPDVSTIFGIFLELLFHARINPFLFVALIVNISFQGRDIVDGILLQVICNIIKDLIALILM